MSNPSNNFSSDLDPYDRLAQMLDGGLFGLLPLPPSWAKYVRAQYAPDPSLPSAPAPAIPGFRKLPDLMGAQVPVDPDQPSFDPLPITPLGASNTPGFDKSPAILDALAAADARPAGFYRSPMFTGAGTTTPGFRPLPMTQIRDTPGFDKSSALQRAGLLPSSFDPSLMPTTGLPAMPFGGGPGELPSTTPPSIGSGLIRAGFSMPSLPPMTGQQQSTSQANDPSLILAQAIPPQSPSPPSPQPKPLQPRPQSPIADSYDPESEDWRGYELVLPDGSTIADNPTVAPGDPVKSRSPTGHVMTPILNNLDEVAAAGRQAGEEYRRQRMNPMAAADAPATFAFNAIRDVAAGGRFDCQRKGNQLGGLAAELLHGPRALEFTQLRQFRPISNINVGLWGQQAGLTLDETLKLADLWSTYIGRANPNSPYNLHPKTKLYIREGYRIGEQGLFRKPASSASPP